MGFWKKFGKGALTGVKIAGRATQALALSGVPVVGQLNVVRVVAGAVDAIEIERLGEPGYVKRAAATGLAHTILNRNAANSNAGLRNSDRLAGIIAALVDLLVAWRNLTGAWKQRK